MNDKNEQQMNGLDADAQAQNYVRFHKLMDGHEMNWRGVPEIVKWLENETDFFHAPASSQYHGAYEGGLVEHSLNVCDILLKLDKDFGICRQCGCYKNDLIFSALLHDVCKTNLYVPSYKNQKVNGVWVTVPCYTIKNEEPLGHGEKSVILLYRNGARMNEDVEAAIRWHMGAYDDACRAGFRDLGNAQERYPLAVWLHIADMIASKWVECGYDTEGAREE